MNKKTAMKNTKRFGGRLQATTNLSLYISFNLNTNVYYQKIWYILSKLEKNKLS